MPKRGHALWPDPLLPRFPFLSTHCYQTIEQLIPQDHCRNNVVVVVLVHYLHPIR